MKKRMPIFLCTLIFFLGLVIMCYPTVSNWIHQQTASYVISNYQDQIDVKTEEEAVKLFAQASAYNQTLTGNVTSFMEAEENAKNNIKDPKYWETFPDLNGIIGVVEIPDINISLPIYHGTEESVLQKGVGHLEGSALPTGEIGDHTVLTGHTGLPSSELFTDLDQLAVGNTFYVQVLNKTFTYKVEEINVVLPSETELLTAQEGVNLVTLVTCTPYGINSHRLLVRGVLQEDEMEELSSENTLTDVLETNEIEQEKNTKFTQYLEIFVGSWVVLSLVIIGIVLISVYHKSKKRKVKSQKQKSERR